MSWSADTRHGSYGARRPTYDIDIAPSTALDNLHRLSEALRDLCAGIRVDGLDEGLPFDSSAESLRGINMLNLRTPMGDLDITFAPAGFPDGYDGLRPRARPYSIGHLRVYVADLDDVIKSKTAAAWPKDLDALPETHRLPGRATVPRIPGIAERCRLSRHWMPINNHSPFVVRVS
jgi:hypothetical protein